MTYEYVPQCETVQVHEEIVDRVHEILPPEEALYDLAELYKVFGDSTRIPPAQGAEEFPAGLFPPGGQDHHLLSGRRPCAHHSGPGYGTHRRMTPVDIFFKGAIIS